MRSRISPDGTKLVVSTAAGFLLIVHDLDLTTLASDLNGFRPLAYYGVQSGQSYDWEDDTSTYNHLFMARRNRVELISDFPALNDAMMITSLDVSEIGITR